MACYHQELSQEEKSLFLYQKELWVHFIPTTKYRVKSFIKRYTRGQKSLQKISQLERGISSPAQPAGA